MSWNYRVVKFAGAFDEPYYEIKEVYYNRDGSLMGFCDATVASESFEGIIEVLDQMKTDAHRIIIDEEEFYRVDTKQEESDMPCNQNCQQGRECQCGGSKSNRTTVIVATLMIIALVSMGLGVWKLFHATKSQDCVVTLKKSSDVNHP